ncbi:MAG: nucleoside triphosphate pyrophosphohydrolase [candidate division NC10 bacterium]|nr:nucleoside triphosphate pyrophosphohydrolase [candidate division NC10 bacterium]MBI4392033.1 nucleoside triphosphate pyrophosphohydrolase [candidate division NC10 bacterium]
MPDEPGPLFAELTAIMARLRGPGGCPWDREQTSSSIAPYLLEETYEVLEAIREGKPTRLREELGDVLLQVVFHAEMAAEAGQFTIADVLRGVSDKLVRRHPHVFGDAEAKTAAEVLVRWEAIKQHERESGGEPASALAGVPRSLPALLRAHRLQEKASRAGFDWPALEGVLAKVEEEWRELKAALEGGQPARVESELGDLLFGLVNLSRFAGVNPEMALTAATERFIRRFHHIEAVLARRGKTPRESTLDEMDLLWEEAKRREAQEGGPVAP